MLKSCLKVYLLLFISFICVLPAYATYTRGEGMGLWDEDSQRDNSWMVDGVQSYIYSNPAYVGRFKDRIFFEYQTGQSLSNNADNDYLGGLILNPMGGLSIGIFSGLPTVNVWNDGTGGLYDIASGTYTSESSPAIDDLTDPGNDEDLMDQKVTILSSYEMGMVTLGVILGYGGSGLSDENKTSKPDAAKESEKTEYSNGQYLIGVGGIADISSQMSLDVAATLTILSLSNTYEYDDTTDAIKERAYETDGAMDFELLARLNYGLSERHKLHARTLLKYMNRSTKASSKVESGGSTDELQDTYDRSGIKFALGLSDEMKISADTIVFLGFDFIYKSFDYEYQGEKKSGGATTYSTNPYIYSTSEIVMPLIMGLESKLSENWTGRFGISHNIVDYNSTENITKKVSDSDKDDVTDESSVETSTSQGADSNVAIGLSYDLGNFRFDWVANIELFVIGPWLVGGANMPGDMATSFAVTYKFGETGSGDNAK